MQLCVYILYNYSYYIFRCALHKLFRGLKLYPKWSLLLFEVRAQVQ